MCSFALSHLRTNGYEYIAACVTYMRNRNATLVFPKRYAQIAACGTYIFRLLLPATLSIFFDERSIAANILGVLPAVLLLIFGSGPISVLLLLIGTLKVIRVLRSPLLVGLALPASATFLAAASYLSLFETRVRRE
jgi:hypothetical protein